LRRSQRRFSNGVTTVATPFQSPGKYVDQFRRRSRVRRQAREQPTAVLDRNLELFAAKNGRFHLNRLIWR
jgi:hypothetical protein